MEERLDTHMQNAVYVWGTVTQINEGLEVISVIKSSRSFSSLVLSFLKLY